MLLSEAIKIRITNLIEEKNKSSRYELSCEAGLNPSTLNDFYRGKIAYPRIDTLYLICDSFGITLEEFFSDDIFNRNNIEVEKDQK